MIHFPYFVISYFPPLNMRKFLPENFLSTTKTGCIENEDEKLPQKKNFHIYSSTFNLIKYITFSLSLSLYVQQQIKFYLINPHTHAANNSTEENFHLKFYSLHFTPTFPELSHLNIMKRNHTKPNPICSLFLFFFQNKLFLCVFFPLSTFFCIHKKNEYYLFCKLATNSLKEKL